MMFQLYKRIFSHPSVNATIKVSWKMRFAFTLMLLLSLSCTGCIFAARHLIQELNGSNSSTNSNDSTNTEGQ